MFKNQQGIKIATFGKIVSVLVLVFAGRAFTQVSCPLIPSKGPVPIYRDDFFAGWTTTGSWGTTNTSATPTFTWGSNALQVQFAQNWTGIEFHSSVPVDTTNREFVSFRIRKEDSSSLILITAERNNGSPGTVGTWVDITPYIGAPGSTFAASTWYSVRVPFSAMNISLNAVIQGIIFESSLPTTVYFDNVVILSGLKLGNPIIDQTNAPTWSPWNAAISSGFDHTMTKTLTSDTDPVVTAWTGEKGDGASNANDPTCRAKSAADQYGLTFSLNGHYTGAASCGGVAYLSYNGHPAIDFVAPIGTAVAAADTGTIIASEPGSDPSNQMNCPSDKSTCVGRGAGYGRIRIQHANGYTTWYMHLSRQAGGLTVGSVVNKGMIIGYSGQTSPPQFPVSPHLHFVVATGPDFPGTAIDPYGWTGNYQDPYTTYHNLVFNSRQW